MKSLMMRAVTNQQRYLELKGDIEVYLGFYLIVVWPLGWSHFVAIMLYW